jgi:hypothetical protein
MNEKNVTQSQSFAFLAAGRHPSASTVGSTSEHARLDEYSTYKFRSPKKKLRTVNNLSHEWILFTGSTISKENFLLV